MTLDCDNMYRYLANLIASSISRAADTPMRLTVSGQSSAKQHRSLCKVRVACQPHLIVIGDADSHHARRTIALYYLPDALVLINSAGLFSGDAREVDRACVCANRKRVVMSGTRVFTKDRSADSVEHPITGIGELPRRMSQI
jgi:hypothetical protein